MSTVNRRVYYDHLGRPPWSLINDDDDHGFQNGKVTTKAI